jgi:hypothetical protein
MGPRSILLCLLAAGSLTAGATPRGPDDGVLGEAQIAHASVPRAPGAACQDSRAVKRHLEQQRLRRQREATARRLDSPRPTSDGPISEPYSPPYWAIGAGALVLAAAWYLVRRKR